MSVIVYGPQGSGKTVHAPRLANHFRCDRIVNAKDPEAPADLYTFAQSDPNFKSESILYITNEPAPIALRDSRRVVSIAMALSCVLSHDMRGLETFSYGVRFAIDGMHGARQRLDEVSARTVLARLGTPLGLQTMDAIVMTERALKFLGWTEHDQLQPWLQERLFKRPNTTKERA